MARQVSGYFAIFLLCYSSGNLAASEVRQCGSLVICGGGAIPEIIRERFLQLAGGANARLVIIPSGGDDEEIESDSQALLSIWRQFGASQSSVLHTRSRDTADDSTFVEPLRHATGVWISGGRQSVLARTYAGTAVHRELLALLKRNGAIGGTSAGAAIMSGPLIVRGKLFERPGFDLLPGAIIDQHFLVRNRNARLFAAVQQHPGRFGVGIDEGTALVAHAGRLEVIGASTVTFCMTTIDSGLRREFALKHAGAVDHHWLRQWAEVHTVSAGPSSAATQQVACETCLAVRNGFRRIRHKRCMQGYSP